MDSKNGTSAFPPILQSRVKASRVGDDERGADAAVECTGISGRSWPERGAPRIDDRRQDTRRRKSVESPRQGAFIGEHAWRHCVDPKIRCHLMETVIQRSPCLIAAVDQTSPRSANCSRATYALDVEKGEDLRMPGSPFRYRDAGERGS